MQALTYGGYPEAELHKVLEDQCSGNMQQRREHAQELIAATQAVLDKQAAAWSAACAAVGQLLSQLSEAHDRHKEGHAALQSGIKKALDMTQQVQPTVLDCDDCVWCAHGRTMCCVIANA